MCVITYTKDSCLPVPGPNLSLFVHLLSVFVQGLAVAAMIDTLTENIAWY